MAMAGRSSDTRLSAFATSCFPSMKSLTPTSQKSFSGTAASSSITIPASLKARSTRGASSHQS
jgi:hypothetical protein